MIRIIKENITMQDYISGMIVQLSGTIIDILLAVIIIPISVIIINKIKYRNSMRISRAYLKRILNKSVLIYYDLFQIDRSKKDFDSLIIKIESIENNFHEIKQKLSTEKNINKLIMTLDVEIMSNVQKNFNKIIEDIDQLIALSFFSNKMQMLFMKYRASIEASIEVINHYKKAKQDGISSPKIAVYIGAQELLGEIEHFIMKYKKYKRKEDFINRMIFNVKTKWWYIFIYPIFEIGKYIYLVGFLVIRQIKKK